MSNRSRKVVLSIGSNVGDRLAYLQAALDALDETEGLQLDAVSSVHETEPWGKEDQARFLNLVATGTATLEAPELLARCHEIEDANGRERSEVWGPRTLDVDVIVVGEEQVVSSDLCVPHLRARERAFVILPWLEIDPHGSLPGWGPLPELAMALNPEEVRPDAELTARLRVPEGVRLGSGEGRG